MRQVMVVLVLSLMLFCWVAATADESRPVPLTVWYQGFLADVSTGEPIDGFVDVVARLYDVPSGGTALWGPELHASVVVTEGWFNIELGSVVPLPDFNGTSYFLDLRVDGEVMSSRMKLGSVPAAYHAALADSASAAPGDTSSLWEESGGDVYRASGNVGIGTTSPAAALDVSGTARVESLAVTTAPADGYVLTSDATGLATWQELPAGGDSDWTVDGDNMYSAVAGSLGIGTSTPGALVNVVTDASDNIVLESTGTTRTVEFVARTAGAVYDELKLSKHGTAAGGTTAGVSLAGLCRVSSGNGADGLMLQVVSPDPMYFAVHDTVRLRIDAAGTVNVLDVLHLEPTDTIPPNPSNGDMIVYGTSPSQGLYIYINDFWELLVGTVKADPNHPAEAVER